MTDTTQLDKLADALERGLIIARGIERRFGVPTTELYAHMRRRTVCPTAPQPLGPEDVHTVWVIGRGDTVPAEHPAGPTHAA